MKKNKDFDCVEMKRSGAEKVYEHTRNMTLLEELSYWQQQTEKLRQRQAIATYNQARNYGLQRQVELAIATLKQAIDLYPECREMAKTDADFDRVRSDDRFQALLKG
ncbi:hypothetical protein C7B65_00305 [Phormidesmis priestleyi ULC007]|uniref:Tetratricopeptide repeat protein n=1 Tax=Phormidesmis priestleyi ULC007 TaxID=1920490 RepID=A0A2T1DNB0_9CYAN|nr:hypothetical protein [Phormidesmis priestleyi]PSB21904.1 hypothetical protein C7B65_00305 [Phormidesmis priestleyi ULC007]PZO46765.1 MAG: hypothetical protein DCF14_21875 [Phormidesmis priestleyi]